MTRAYFATNRRPDDPKNPKNFTEEIVGDVDSLRFGWVDLAGNALYEDNDLDTMGEKVRIRVAKETAPASHAGDAQVGSREVFDAIAEEMRGGKDALFIMHGYDYTFRESASRAVQVAQWLADKPLVPLFFAWPSLGRGVAPKTYKDERVRAAASGPAACRAILKWAEYLRGLSFEDRSGRRIHLLAHSMGNWVLCNTVKAFGSHVGSAIPPIFDQVILAAADDDTDTLTMAHKMQPIVAAAKRVSVYHNVQDTALIGSDWLMGNSARLGREGPDHMDSLPANVSVVNAAPAIVWSEEVTDGEDSNPFDDFADWERDLTGHQYYRNNARVRGDLLQVLNGVPDEDIYGRSFRNGRWVLG